MLAQRVRGIGLQSRWVEPASFSRNGTGKGPGAWVLPVHLVAEAPANDRGVVAIAGDHLAQLFQPILFQLALCLSSGVLKGLRTPRRHLLLHQNPVAVAKIEDAGVLGPMDACEDAVELLHVGMIRLYPGRWFGHTEFRVTARHALHAHQAHRLAVEEKLCAADLKAANSEGVRMAMRFCACMQVNGSAVHPGRVEMPESGRVNVDWRQGHDGYGARCHGGRNEFADRRLGRGVFLLCGST